MINRNLKKEYFKLVKLYFAYRNCYNFNFQRYAFFRNMIRYITEISEPNFLRSLFNQLLEEDYFQVKEQNGKIFYKYNPYKKEEVIPDKIWIYF